MDDWPYGNHPEPAVLYCSPRSVHSFCGKDTEILPLRWLPRGPRRAVSLVVLQQPRPALVPWETTAGPVPLSDRLSVLLELVVQSRTEMLQKSVLKIYLMSRDLDRLHSPPRGARALA
jgi:hypothetical protein